MQIGILDLMQLSLSEPEKFSVCFVFRFIKHIITVIIAFDLRKPNFIFFRQNMVLSDTGFVYIHTHILCVLLKLLLSND
jgi:hypothetical protein